MQYVRRAKTATTSSL